MIQKQTVYSQSSIVAAAIALGAQFVSAPCYAQSSRSANKPITSAESSKDLTFTLLNVEQLYIRNGFRADQNYKGKRMTFWIYASEIQTKAGRPLVRADIVYYNSNTQIVADIALTTAMSTLAAKIEPGDLLEITATLRGRTILSKDEVVISGGNAPVYTLNGRVSGGAGFISGGTVTRKWPNYTFDSGSVKIIKSAIAIRKELEAHAAAVAKAEQERRDEIYRKEKEAEDTKRRASEVAAADWNVKVRKATYEFDLQTLQQVKAKIGYVPDAIILHYIAMDPSNILYLSTRDCFRYAIRNLAPAFARQGMNLDDITQKVIEAKRASLVQDLMDYDGFKVGQSVGSSTILESYIYHQKRIQKKDQIELGALDIAVIQVIAKHPRAKNIEFASNPYVGSIYDLLWKDKNWVMNDYLEQMRSLFPRRPYEKFINN